MKFNYAKLIYKINKTISERGIPSYIKKWKKYHMKKIYINDNSFFTDLNKFIKSYHSHSSINVKDNSNLKQNKNHKKMPTFYYDNKHKIGRIVFYEYILDFDDKFQKSEKFIEIVNSVKKNISLWVNNGIKGLIIDLRQHKGGWYNPFIYSLQYFLNNNSLFATSDIKVNKRDNNWTNYINNMILYDSKFVNNLNLVIPIAVIIGKKTSSSGEFCASIFYRNNKMIKIFGNNSRGKLSANETFNISSNIQLNIPVRLVTTVDGVFHEKEYLKPDIYTNKPITTAKKWLLYQSDVK